MSICSIRRFTIADWLLQIADLGFVISVSDFLGFIFSVVGPCFLSLCFISLVLVLWFFFLGSCSLVLLPWFLFPGSYFLFPISYFLFLGSFPLL
ncbi:MAG TPA: hypothetical protein VEV83_05610, partial [Parafilimonas sp.]|nr:hypothetical protein [Parafilimonas sp.]